MKKLKIKKVKKGKTGLKGKAKKIFKKDTEKRMKYPKPKFLGLKNKRGQMMIIGILILIMSLLIFIATLPATKDMINVARGCSYLNCGGYVDADASGAGCSSINQTYSSSLEEDTLSCSILDLAIPMLILGVLAALVFKLVQGKLVDEPAPAYGGYGGGY